VELVLTAVDRACLNLEVISLDALFNLYFGKPVTRFKELIAAIIPIIAMTTMSSTRLNPFF
jgi:hypothetical protein